MTETILTNEDAKNGQTKCPKCGATDISQNMQTGNLRCNFCRHELEPEIVESINCDISTLEGEEIGAGIQNIDKTFEYAITLKCQSCGAEIVIETDDTLSARCHWCRNTLSINKQIPSGVVPDAILPFKLQKEEARAKIQEFVKKRKFFAHPKFYHEFTTENIMGVYFPYMTVDINAEASLKGEAETLVRQYTVKRNDKTEKRYDADLYAVKRNFGIMIDNLTIESNTDRLNNASDVKTNNIINAIMPFDIKNCVTWDANYLKGFTSEKRDVDIENVRNIIDEQSKDIARFKINETLTNYDRGVKWEHEDLNIKGQRWHAVYLPVWLYSYQQIKGKNNSLIHYVAVNGRTNEVMGSVPIHMPKLVLASFIAQIFGTIAWFFTLSDEHMYNYLLLLSGLIFFIFYYRKYRNIDARHQHEKDTYSHLDNVEESDEYLKRLKGLKNREMNGANNYKVNSKRGSKFGNILNDILAED